MQSKYVIIFGTALMAVTAGVLRSRHTLETAPATVAAAPVESRTTIVAPGLVEPSSEEVRIGSELDGKLRVVNVDEGDRVARGQVIAVLENADYAARVELAKANLAERQAALERLLNGSRTEERREAAASVREAAAVLDSATAEWDRRKTLLTQGAISKTEFDSAEREYRVAQARLEAANEHFRLVDAAARQDDRMRAEAEVEAAQAERSNAEALLEKTIVRSPIDGVVLRRYRKTGESVIAKDETPIVSLGATGRLRVRVDVDETDVDHLRVGQAAWVRADAYGDRRFTGRVVRIGQELGPKNVQTDRATEKKDTKILETLLELDPGQKLPVGLRVDCYIQRDSRP
ncbi:MAG TPA: efflux RND transporter periplasmic adaptor subunit [Bryobacteraceae bacterium]|nr:efflux RND transporter periplasmic adaptor subunit [Bryobacteraceae bacterium]